MIYFKKLVYIAHTGLSPHALEIEFRNRFGYTSSSSDCVIVYSVLCVYIFGNLYDKGSLNIVLTKVVIYVLQFMYLFDVLFPPIRDCQKIGKLCCQ